MLERLDPFIHLLLAQSVHLADEVEILFGREVINQETIIDDLQRITREYPSLIVVLKSERTLIAGKGEVTINTTGNNALAKGGSGDVLAGMIAGLFAQRETVQSVIAAVYVHSLASDYWLRSHSSYSLLASELIEMADGVLFEMTEKK